MRAPTTTKYRAFRNEMLLNEKCVPGRRGGVGVSGGGVPCANPRIHIVFRFEWATRPARSDSAFISLFHPIFLRDNVPRNAKSPAW